jgi:spore maturation protein CgeB
VLFLERDVPWYANNRDLPNPPYGRTALYRSLQELKDRWTREVRNADFVIVGSYVPQGVLVGDWAISTATGPVAFYDIDTPVTLSKLDRGDTEYISRALVIRYDIYLSFTGGPTLKRLEKCYCANFPRELFCSVDAAAYYPDSQPTVWDMGYLGTYSDDRQPALNRLMLEAARRWPDGRFCVAGSLYPPDLAWPANVERIEHLPPARHRGFYNSQSWTLNVTRAEMVRAGYSPSVRLFEAAACGTPIITDAWPGLGEIFEVGSEVLVARSTEESLDYVRSTSEQDRRSLGEKARARVLAEHTSERRAEQLELYALEAIGSTPAVTKAAG